MIFNDIEMFLEKDYNLSFQITFHGKELQASWKNYLDVRINFQYIFAYLTWQKWDEPLQKLKASKNMCIVDCERTIK